MYLCGDDHLVADAPLLHPLADELFGRFVLIAVRRIDEVAASLVKSVQQLEAACLVHHAEPDLVPLVPNAHRPKAQRRDVYTGEGGELSVSPKRRLGRWRLDEEARARHGSCMFVRADLGSSEQVCGTAVHPLAHRQAYMSESRWASLSSADRREVIVATLSRDLRFGVTDL